MCYDLTSNVYLKTRSFHIKGSAREKQKQQQQ